MPIRKLIGGDESAVYTGGSDPYIYGTFLTSIYAGIATRYRIYLSLAVGNIKFALYDGSGNLIHSDETSTPVGGSDDWGNFDGYSVAISDATPYVPAGQGDVYGAISRTDTEADSGFIVTHTYSTPFPDPINMSSTRTYEAAIQIWGYIPPTISEVNGGASIAHGDEVVPVDGSDFVDSGGDPTFYLCPTSTFVLEDAVEQVTTSPGDSTSYITVDATGLTPGIVYMFAKTALGQLSDSFAVTLSGTGPVSSANAALMGCSF